MIRWFILPALALAIGGLVATNLAEDPGYVMIQIAGYTLESSLAGLVLLAVVTIAVATLGARLIGKGVTLPSKVGGLMQERRAEAARKQLHLGLGQLAAGQFDRAEAELLRRIADSDNPASNYLLAAEAAHKQGRGKQRDEYLALADESGDSKHQAVLLKKAELWAQDGNNTAALEALDELLTEQPRHKTALGLKMQLLRKEQRWDELKQCLPQIRSILSSDIQEELARDTHRALLGQARASGRVDQLRATWQDIPGPLKHDTSLIAYYAGLCHELQIDADALRLIVAELRHHWHADLVLIFGEMDGGDVVRQLAKVEEWIKQYGEKAELLLVAGRLCLRNRLWGRARSYFEACLSSYPSAEIRLELGKLLVQQGENETEALQLFREGLESAVTPRLTHVQHGELLPQQDDTP